MRAHELRVRLGIVLRRRMPGARAAQRRLVRPDLWRTKPVSSVFGFDRGTPIERHYLERYLEAHAGDIRGRVLEIGDAHYTKRFGADRVTRSDVLDVDASNRRATIVGDLETGEGIPAAAFDCIVCTQTLMLVFDVAAAVRHLAGALASGGVLLGSVSGIGQISELDRTRTGEYWRFTTDSMRRLLGDELGDVSVEARGNVLSSVAFLHGLAAEELDAEELAAHDPRYELVVLFRAVKLAR